MGEIVEQRLVDVPSAVEKKKGKLKIFLGYAPGVGKTYSMLSEAIQRRRRGDYIVIGVVETHGRKAIIELAEQLEMVPRRKIDYKGAAFEEMDIDRILARRPQVVLVDELAHSNIPGSKHSKRYEDVLELLDSDIDVVSTVNIQHIETVASTVHEITGVIVRETVPDSILKLAAEVVMTDLTPEALRDRLEHGEVYSMEKVEQALKTFFREGNLIALRELALRQVTEQVDLKLKAYMEQKGIREALPARERIAVCVSLHPWSKYVMARAARMARRVDAELYALHLDIDQDSDPQANQSLTGNLKFSESLGAKVVRIGGRQVARAIADFARDKHITAIVFGRSKLEGWRRIAYLNTINELLDELPAVDVHIMPQEHE